MALNPANCFLSLVGIAWRRENIGPGTWFKRALRRREYVVGSKKLSKLRNLEVVNRKEVKGEDRILTTNSEVTWPALSVHHPSSQTCIRNQL
jgi:hypothetical protein